MKLVEIKQFGAAQLPQRQTPGSAGYDLFSTEDCMVHAGATVAIPCGFGIALPQGYVALVCSRSGLARSHNLHVLNAPGIIDSDFRGEVHALVHNAGSEAYAVSEGDRIAQLVIMHHLMPDFVVVKELPPTQRGEGGLGSTGYGGLR